MIKTLLMNRIKIQNNIEINNKIEDKYLKKNEKITIL